MLELENVFEVGAEGDIQVVEAVWQVEFVVVSRHGGGDHADAELLVPGHESTPDALFVVVEQIERLLVNLVEFRLHFCLLDHLRSLLLISRLFLFFDKVNDAEA